MFTIEKNIPIPPVDKGTRRGKSMYPIADMEVGDSFLAPAEKIRSLRCIIYKFIPKKFSVLKTEGGYRVWRIK